MKILLWRLPEFISATMASFLGILAKYMYIAVSWQTVLELVNIQDNVSEPKYYTEVFPRI